jgi:hypothetical protein
MPRVPKTRVAVGIPDVFMAFMRHVAALIDSGDEATTIESDDLLQCDCIYGGLSDGETKRFTFRYFHAQDAIWDVDLDAFEIAGIANGSFRQLNLWRCSDGSCGCLYPAEDSYCPHCDSIRHFDHEYAKRLRHLYPEASLDALASMANLRRIALAIGDYVDANDGQMPPPFTFDVSGNRLHSWRSLILPYLDLDDLYAVIDFNQAWDTPVNRAATAAIPGVFQSPGTASCHTRYLAIVGQDTLWPPSGRRRLSDVTSGTSRTIAVVEAPASECHWMEPRDIGIDALAGQLASHGRSLSAAWIDGNATALSGLDASSLRELATISPNSRRHCQT